MTHSFSQKNAEREITLTTNTESETIILTETFHNGEQEEIYLTYEELTNFLLDLTPLLKTNNHLVAM